MGREDEAWRDQARCKGADRRLFFPPEPGDPDWSESTIRMSIATRKRYEKANWYCQHCPVRDECLEFALGGPDMDRSKRENHGFWGGMSPDERRDLIKHRQREVLKEKRLSA